jgi:hypothetical protein
MFCCAAQCVNRGNGCGKRDASSKLSPSRDPKICTLSNINTDRKGSQGSPV